jgi:bifunctional non-homologous end joining protein LigD
MPKLQEYGRKRQFDRTPEPPPEEAASGNGTFVVQKHAARRLHYDFRLGVDGVLKSWAVPKGPSLNPADKRLAVQTEDHPMDYASFEGNIPEGNYGAGSVMVWDRGTFSPEGNLDASKQIVKGEIKFSVQGEKLRGSFVLVKLKNSEKGNEWLMIKHNDSAVDPNWDIDQHDGSVLTGRTLDEISEHAPPKREASAMRPSDIPGALKTPMPSRIDPMLATLIDKPFSDSNWLFEIKWDGVRTLAWIRDGVVKLQSRLANDVTSHYPEMAALAKSIAAKEAIVDGEIVVLDERGHSNFERLQERMHVRAPSPTLLAKHSVTFYAFDLLYSDGYDLRSAPVIERKNLLRRLLHPNEHIRFSDHQLEKGKELYELVRAEGLEGIVGKRSDSAYVSTRSRNWVKVKADKTLDAVVGGWTAPRAGRSHLGSLLLGLYDKNKLKFVGHVGTGFDEPALANALKELHSRQISKSPFDKVPETNQQAYWARPELVAHIRYGSWTDVNHLRHPVFLGFREDVRPEDCRVDTEAAVPEPPPAATAPTPQLVQSPSVIGEVLTDPKKIEAELFNGKQENINIELEGKRLRLTNLNKIYFPESGYTKRDLLAYYYRMADTILPFLKDRPMVLRRYPDGIKGEAFFQKDMPPSSPEWLPTVAIPAESRGGGPTNFALCNDRAALIYLTGLGCIDHNPWSSRYDDPAHPDYFFYDLDPADGTEFSVVMKVAKALHDKLKQLGLKFFMKTSGATGFHMFLPVERVYTYDQLRTFGEIIARLATTKIPELITHERTVAKRKAGTVLIDVTQNSEGRPLACAYSVRAFPKAPVSTPLLPRELRPTLKPEKFNMKTLFARIEKEGDLWAGFWASRQRIEPAMEKISALVSSE